MANKILIEGPTGTGKSFSIRTLDPSNTFIINPDEKSLPFKGWKSKYIEKKNIVSTGKFGEIKQWLKTISEKGTHIKTVVIDTISHAMVADFMRMALNKELGYDKFSIAADNFYTTIKMLDGLREDLMVVIFAHTESNESTGKSEFKVPGGKLVKDKIIPASLFTTVLSTEVVKKENSESEFYFRTKTNGSDEVKSPVGMFEKELIPNDLNYVINCVNKFENE